MDKINDEMNELMGRLRRLYRSYVEARRRYLEARRRGAREEAEKLWREMRRLLEEKRRLHALLAEAARQRWERMRRLQPAGRPRPVPVNYAQLAEGLPKPPKKWLEKFRQQLAKRAQKSPCMRSVLANPGLFTYVARRVYDMEQSEKQALKQLPAAIAELKAAIAELKARKGSSCGVACRAMLDSAEKALREGEEALARPQIYHPTPSLVKALYREAKSLRDWIRQRA